MSNTEINMKIELVTRGPILCSSTGQIPWGVDLQFNKDYAGKVFIPKSHLKGKLKDAWRFLNSIDPSFMPEIEKWLGKENADGKYIPERAHLFISDFYLSDDKNSSFLLNRIQIENESGTTDEGALLTVETPFNSNEIISWLGNIQFCVESKQKENIINKILQGLRWNTSIGAFKGIGYGRLVSVKYLKTESSDKEITIKIKYANKNKDVLGLKIFLLEPFMVGGFKKDNNYIESESIIPGSVIKGALATSINQRLGKDLNSPITPGDKLPLLTKYFSDIRFTHAIPGDVKVIKRPTILPLSYIKAGKQFYDIVIDNKSDNIENEPIDFQIDWKESPSLQKFGLKSPRTISFTRTEIEPESLRSKEEKLYTFQYVCPVDNKGVDLAWYSNVYLPENLSETEINSLYSELLFVIEEWFDKIGKRNSAMKVVPSNDPIESFMPNLGLGEKYVVISLQTDTLMLNPKDLDGSNVNIDLNQLYNDYWQSISAGSLNLEDGKFFAQQKLAGGFVSIKYMQNNGFYEPFLLTKSGSVFVLNIKKKDKAHEKLKKWMHNGLELPKWVKVKYGNGGNPAWQDCPFLPQNGFGEMNINLSCHYNEKPKYN